MDAAREQQIESALFRGDCLTLENPNYLHTLRAFTETLLREDIAPRDLTVEVLGINGQRASAIVLARERGVVAGLEEFSWMFRNAGVCVTLMKKDGDILEREEILLEAKGERSKLLSLERVGINLLQRMSGIATATRCLVERVRSRGFSTRIVATRKTPWGLLDKRAVHHGGGGTHRLGLGDAILIKNNHLTLVAGREEEAAPVAIARAWNFRKDAAFIEVEVRSEDAAFAAAKTFRRLREEAGEAYPCLLMLDNLMPEEIGRVLKRLRRENLWDHALIEASGGISETNIEAYAACGVDAISIGALTHSPRALDLSQRIS